MGDEARLQQIELSARVSLLVYPDRIVVGEGQVICEHQRAFARSHDRQSRTVRDWRHYLAVVHRKPGACMTALPSLRCPRLLISVEK